MIAAAPENLPDVFDRAFAGISQAREAVMLELTPREVGTITNVFTGIARVSGLPGVGFEELVQFPGGVSGIAFNVDEDRSIVVELARAALVPFQPTPDETPKPAAKPEPAQGNEPVDR